jgi:DNA-binding Xre family transcriptional regulator
MTIKSLLAELLKDESYDLQRIANETGISEQTLRQISSGKTKEPRFKTVQLLLALYFTVQLSTTA